MMLNFRWGHTKETVRNFHVLFDDYVQNEWLNHPFVKEMVKAIDKTDIIKDRYIESPIFGAISPRELSGGVKGIILMMFEPEREYYGEQFGNNCAEWILKVADMHDINMGFRHFMEFPEPFKLRIVNDGSIITNNFDLIRNKFKYDDLM